MPEPNPSKKRPLRRLEFPRMGRIAWLEKGLKITSMGGTGRRAVSFPAENGRTRRGKSNFGIAIDQISLDA